MKPLFGEFLKTFARAGAAGAGAVIQPPAPPSPSGRRKKDTCTPCEAVKDIKRARKHYLGAKD